MSILAMMVALKAPVLLHSKVLKMPVMPSNSSTDMIGKDALWKSVKTVSLVLLAAALVVAVEVSEAALELVEALAHEVALVVVADLVVGMVDVVVTQEVEAVLVVLHPLSTAALRLLQPHQTHLQTLLLQVVSEAKSFSCAMYVGSTVW